jgi:cholesterol oxidase
MDDTHFDAVIIGSGFGGSVMAYRLAEAGLKVCLLERGKAFPPFSFPRAPHKVRDNFWDPSDGLYGMYNVWSFKGSGALVSSGLGGGSLIYANIIIRKDAKWFDDPAEGWPVTRAELEPHYDRVDDMMNTQKYPLDYQGFPKPPKTLAMKEAAAELKAKCKDSKDTIEWIPLNLAVSFKQRHAGGPNAPHDSNNPPVTGEPIEERWGTNYHGKTRYTCVNCGECDFGCNTGSKNTLDYTYITAAKHQGADIRTLCEVKSFAPNSAGNGYEIHYTKHEPDSWREPRDRDSSYTVPFTSHKITARRLIVSAGAYGSPFLLLKNRDSFPNLKANPNLGKRFGLNGDMLSFLVKSQEKKKDGRCGPRILDPSFGPVITSAIRVGDELDGKGDKGRGFYVEDGGNPYLLSWGAELAGISGFLARAAHLGKRYLQYYLGFNHDADLDKEIAAVLGDCAVSKGSLPILTMGRDYADGKLTLDKDGLLQCDWDIKKSQDYYNRVLRIGRGIARAIHAEYMENPLYEYFKQVMTAHPLGGCPMGHDKQVGVVDSYGEVFGHPGLYVLDGSIMPGPVGPNPSMTIAAVSDRAADHIVDQHKGVTS